MNRNRDVAVTINGKAFKARVSLQMLAEIEDLAGPLPLLGQSLMQARVRVTTVTGIVSIILGDKVTEDDMLSDLPGCVKTVTAVILAILNVPLNNVGDAPGEPETQNP
jgi:hypothetical protein